MTVSVITREQALERVKHSLHLPVSEATEGISVALVAQTIRRAVHILAPCPAYELERSVRHALSGLGLGVDGLDALVNSTLEMLAMYGDILEMRVSEHDTWSGSAFVMRPAAPSFVERKDGSVVILGVGGDIVTPVPDEIAVRLIYRGSLRLLQPHADEKLPAELRALGLRQFDEKAWLRLPASEKAESHLAQWKVQLNRTQVSENIEGLLICDTPGRSAFYPDRWTPPATRHSGIYVARRPQRYGANLWCLAELQSGKVARFLDLFSSGDRNRACDIAWRIQMALDSFSGNPQKYQCRGAAGQRVFDFFSPIPSWAEKRLALVGTRIKGEHCLFSYEIDATSSNEERAFLEEYLWLASI